MARLRTSATVSGRARPRCPITRCAEMARTDSDWTQLSVAPAIGAYGDMEGQPALAAGDRGHDELLVA